jgi:O-antigen/teichoic acid export membrane protein
MKLTKMLLALVTSLGSVLLPRLSYYIANGKHEEFDRMLDKSFSVVLLICLPIVAGLMLLSSETLQVFAGSKFLPAASCTLFTAPVILFIGLSNILGIQILYPLGKDKLVVASVTVGAVLSFVLNLVLIPRFAHFGAAVATLVAEFGVFAVQVVLVAKVYRIRWPFASIAKYAAAVAVMTVAVLSVKWAVQPAWERLLVGVPIGALVYTGLVLAMKDKFAVESAGVLLAKVRRA